MEEIEKLRKSKPESLWTVRIVAVAAALTYISLLLQVLTNNSGIAALLGATFAMTVLWAYAVYQQRLNRALLTELDEIKATLRN